MIRTLRLDVRVDVINECADRGNGQHALRDKVSAPSNTRDARLPVWRLGGVLPRGLGQKPPPLFGHGGGGRKRGKKMGGKLSQRSKKFKTGKGGADDLGGYQNGSPS